MAAAEQCALPTIRSCTRTFPYDEPAPVADRQPVLNARGRGGSSQLGVPVDRDLSDRILNSRGCLVNGVSGG